MIKIKSREVFCAGLFISVAAGCSRLQPAEGCLQGWMAMPGSRGALLYCSRAEPYCRPPSRPPPPLQFFPLQRLPLCKGPWPKPVSSLSALTPADWRLPGSGNLKRALHLSLGKMALCFHCVRFHSSSHTLDSWLLEGFNYSDLDRRAEWATVLFLWSPSGNLKGEGTDAGVWMIPAVQMQWLLSAVSQSQRCCVSSGPSTPAMLAQSTLTTVSRYHVTTSPLWLPPKMPFLPTFVVLAGKPLYFSWGHNLEDKRVL